MKNTRLLPFLLLALFIFQPFNNKGQSCPYGFQTTTGCTIDLDVQFYKYDGNTVCQPCGGVFTIIGLTSSSPQSISCAQINSNCPLLTGAICKVEVTMTAPATLGPVANGNQQTTPLSYPCAGDYIVLDVAFAGTVIRVP